MGKLIDLYGLNEFKLKMQSWVNSSSNKVSLPSSSPQGTQGQLLQTNGDGTTAWVDAGTPSDAQVESAVSDWLDEHPEATTSVEDGSITRQKLDSTLQGKVDSVDNQILIQSTQPTSTDNKLWVPDSDVQEVQVPSWEEFEEVKDAVFMSASLEWEQGIYNWTSGTVGSSSARIRSNKVSKNGLVKASCETGFKFVIHAWNGETYIGNLKTDGTFATSSSSVAWITEYSFTEAPNYTYAFVMQRTSGNATPEDGVNFVLEYDNIALANDKVSELDGTVNGLESVVNGISTLTNENEQEISLFNSGDLCAHPSGDASTGETDISGVTFTKVGDDRYRISGTNSGSSSAQFRLYANINALPNGVIPGETYYADYYSDYIGCNLQILTNGSSGSGYTSLLDRRRGGEFTVPSDARGMIIRLSISVGLSIDTVVRPRIFSVKSLQYAQLHKEKNTRPMLSIVYDDGFKDFDTYIMPIVRQKKIPIATAIIPEAIPVHDYLMTWEEIQACYADGAEVLPHFGAYSEAEWAGFGSQDISWRYYKTLNALRAHSIYTPDVLVFSGSSSRYAITRVAARRIFNAGFNASNGGINYYGKFDPYYINRYSADNKTLDELKAWIDELIAANDGWMVWTRHNGSDYVYGQDAAYAAQVLSDAIDYALSKGVQIVTVERGLNEYLDM